MGPNEVEAGVPHHENDRPSTHDSSNSHASSDTHNRTSKRSPASAWRDGYRRGALDGLRRAGRRLPPECWAILEDLADEYELAGDG
jgi:hypothetical protein